MKKLLVALIVLICHQSFARQSMPFGIYLLKDDTLNGYEAVEIGLNNLLLRDAPILRMQDFVSYRCSDHSFELTKIGKNKIPDGKLRGLPFVFVANNSKIYLGALWTSFSSFDFGYPVIDTEWFKFNGELKIARAYPHDGFATGADPRARSEIIEELKRAHLLKDSCP